MAKGADSVVCAPARKTKPAAGVFFADNGYVPSFEAKSAAKATAPRRLSLRKNSHFFSGSLPYRLVSSLYFLCISSENSPGRSRHRQLPPVVEGVFILASLP